MSGLYGDFEQHRIARETEAFAAHLNASFAEQPADTDEAREFAEDLAKARAAMEVAWRPAAI